MLQRGEKAAKQKPLSSRGHNGVDIDIKGAAAVQGKTWRRELKTDSGLLNVSRLSVNCDVDAWHHDATKGPTLFAFWASSPK